MWYVVLVTILILLAGYGGYAYGRKVEAKLVAEAKAILEGASKRLE